MKKLLSTIALLTSSLVLAQDVNLDANLPSIVKNRASQEFLFTGIEIPVLQQLMGDPTKSDTKTYDLKDAGGFELNYKVKKSDAYIQIFESKMTYWITMAAYVTPKDVFIGMVTSAQKASLGRGNDLSFFSLSSKKPVSSVDNPLFDYEQVVKFANGKCKVPKENIHFELKENSDTILISGFDIFLKGRKYGLSGKLKLTGSKFVFDSKSAKCK